MERELRQRKVCPFCGNIRLVSHKRGRTYTCESCRKTFPMASVKIKEVGCDTAVPQYFIELAKRKAEKRKQEKNRQRV